MLKSTGRTPRSISQRPAGPSFGIAPAGEMWSVVTVSPSSASTRAPCTSSTGLGARAIPSKNGGWATYVESATQANRPPAALGTARACHASSPSNTPAYCARYMSGRSARPTASSISSALGQTSRR